MISLCHRLQGEESSWKCGSQSFPVGSPRETGAQVPGRCGGRAWKCGGMGWTGSLHPLPRVTPVSMPPGPPCPGAATLPAFSSPPRRTPQWRPISGMRWSPVAYITSTRRSSKCFPRYILTWSRRSGKSVVVPRSARLYSACGCYGLVQPVVFSPVAHPLGFPRSPVWA